MIKKIHVNADGEPTETANGRNPDAIPGVPRCRWGRHLTRNLALAGMLLLTVTAVRSAHLPTGETVLTAVQSLIDGPWDDRLGKISFVSTLFPEAVSVFFESPTEEALVSPCFGRISHPWRSDEPYIGYAADDSRVFAVAPGQVMSVAHGNGEELVVRVRQEDGLETLYYGLVSLAVREGDIVTGQTCLGRALPSREILIEVRRSGLPIDPTPLLSPRPEVLP